MLPGETGAGKSIILGALGLVLGKRADLTSFKKNKEEKMYTEAHFEISKYNLAPFELNGFDIYEQKPSLGAKFFHLKVESVANDSPTKNCKN
jgi:DNA repair protein RecN (Recombination protein N)